MTAVQFIALPHETRKSFRDRASDTNRQKPKAYISDGSSIPCYHCLNYAEMGDGYLLLVNRFFPDTQPYAGVGPIFIHSKGYQHFDNLSQVPKMISARNQMIIRGYSVRNRIVEDTGQLIETKNIQAAAKHLLKNIQISCLHVRSVSNNCFQCRIERG